MRPRRRPLPPVAAAAALALAFAVPAAMPAQDGGFRLRLDSIVLEGLSLDQDTASSKLQEYRDLSDGFRVQLGLAGASADELRRLELEIVDGGRADAFYGFSYDVAGRWGLKLAYDRTPHRFGRDGKILWSRTNQPGAWQLQDPIQAANQAAIEAQFAANPAGITFAFLDGLIQPYLADANTVDLGLDRRRTSAVLDLGGAGAASWKLEYRHESRTGLRSLGTSFGFNNVTELPEPIDYDTTDATLSGAWRWDRGVVQAGYRYSKFENAISTLTWDNPWRATDSTDPSAYSAPGAGSIGGAVRGQLDLAPDNEMGSFFANGRVGVGPAGWLQAAVSWSRMEQDDPLLGMTLNTAIAPVAQPYARAGREADLVDVALDYGVRFGAGWQAGARYVHRDYSDDSPRYRFEEGYVRYHAVHEEIPRITVPYGWTRDTLSARVDKDLGGWGGLGLELKRDRYDRELRETEETTEDTLALSWDGRLAGAQLRAKLEAGERDYDVYRTEAQLASFLHPETVNNLPGLRKYDQANRDLLRWTLQGSRTIGTAWTASAHVIGAELDYGDSEFGLTGDETVRYGFDLSRDLGEGSALFLFAERSEREVAMDARQSGSAPSVNPLDDWDAEFEEINHTLGAGWSKTAADWRAALSVEWVESDGDADLTSPPGGSPNTALGFDNYEDYDRLALRGDYDRDLTASLAMGVGVLYEEYSIDSFIRQDLRNYLPGALLIFADDGGYTAWSGSVRLTAKF